MASPSKVVISFAIPRSIICERVATLIFLSSNLQVHFRFEPWRQGSMMTLLGLSGYLALHCEKSGTLAFGPQARAPFSFVHSLVNRGLKPIAKGLSCWR